jgi:glycosyltransferase involved in cell wall biosynthesis
MRIALLSYPMLSQRDLAMQAQVRATTRALQAVCALHGMELTVDLVDPSPRRLAQFDLIHVFSSGGGNHRLVEAAAAMGLPVVLSAQVSPGWDRACGEQARRADHHLCLETDWTVRSGYAQARHALQLANVVVATAQSEKMAIEEGFLIDGAKVRVVSNGISASLFEADSELFCSRTGLRGPFVLMDGAISPYRNQLGIAQALGAVGLPLVLLGEARERDQQYLRQVRAVGGVTCLGGLKQDAPLLASAYAAASVLVLPAAGERCAQTVFDALAAGTPVVTGPGAPSDITGSALALREVACETPHAWQEAVLGLIRRPPARAEVRELVRPYTWERAAQQLAFCYLDLLASRHTIAA